MDPDEALRRFRELVDGEAVDAAQVMLDLDEWLSKGGFLPAAWVNAPIQRGIYSCGLCSKTSYIDGTPTDEGPCIGTDGTLTTPDGKHAIDVLFSHGHAHSRTEQDPECQYCKEGRF